MTAIPENEAPIGSLSDGVPVASEAMTTVTPAHEAGAGAAVEAASEEEFDRRVHPRRKKFLRVLVSDALAVADPFPGWVVDRSIGGMCLSVDREIEEGSVLRVRRPSEANGPWIEVRVQSVRPKDDNWDLGCEFLRSPTWEILLQFG